MNSNARFTDLLYLHTDVTMIKDIEQNKKMLRRKYG